MKLEIIYKEKLLEEAMQKFCIEVLKKGRGTISATVEKKNKKLILEINYINETWVGNLMLKPFKKALAKQVLTIDKTAKIKEIKK